MKHRLGLDWWDVAIQVFVTICVAAAVSGAAPREGDITVPGVLAL